ASGTQFRHSGRSGSAQFAALESITGTLQPDVGCEPGQMDRSDRGGRPEPATDRRWYSAGPGSTRRPHCTRWWFVDCERVHRQLSNRQPPITRACAVRVLDAALGCARLRLTRKVQTVEKHGDDCGDAQSSHLRWLTMKYLPWTASKARLRQAENARKNRLEIVKALSHGQVSRRDLLKLGLFTGAGFLAPIGGLNPFVGSANSAGGSDIPTAAPPSPLFGVQPFTQPMPRFNVLPRNPVSSLNPFPTARANQTQRAVD